MLENFRADLARYHYATRDRPLLFTYLTKQGLWAITEYRFSHWVRRQVHVPILRQVLQAVGLIWHKLIEITTGIDLPNRAQIGKGLYIPHFGEIIVNADAVLGDYCTISQGVTIGSAGRGDQFGVPVIGDRVYLAPGVKVIGAITIGDDVAVGANAVVTKDLPDQAVAVGVPAKVISHAGSSDFIGYPPASGETPAPPPPSRESPPRLEPQPLVTVLINNFNYGRYLEEAIVSALNQTYPAIEVIVVDDGSTDQETAAVLAAYGDRLQIIRKPNGGQASAFNAGFAASQGEIICFLDADDFFAPDKVARVVAALASDPQLGWCFHPLAMLDHQTRTYAPPVAYQGEAGVYDLTRLLRRGKLEAGLPFTGMATSGICFRRSLLAQLLPMPEVIRITSDDYLKYAALALTPGYILLDALTSQRLHGDNAYTQRSDKRLLFAQISVLTAYWLRHKFPVMQMFCDNLFASGINFYRGFRRVNGSDQPLVTAYLKETPRWERLQIYLKVFYYRCRS